MPCKTVIPPVFSPSMPAQFDQNFSGFAQMSFMHNPYYLYGNASMTSISWSTPTINNSFSYTYPENASKSYSQPKIYVKAKGQRPTSKVKVDLTYSKPKEEKHVTKPNASTNKLGPKQFGYQYKNDFVFDCVQGKRKNLWYLVNGCSRHMTGDSTLLTAFVERADPSITFGDDMKGCTMGYDLISKENVIIDSIALVDGLKHNLLSISQLCDKGNEVWFTKEACVISDKTTGNFLLTGNRKENVYVADFNSTRSEGMT